MALHDLWLVTSVIFITRLLLVSVPGGKERMGDIMAHACSKGLAKWALEQRMVKEQEESKEPYEPKDSKDSEQPEKPEEPKKLE